MKKKLLLTVVALALCLSLMGNTDSCGGEAKTSDVIQREQQERILAEGTAQIGMPSIKNFREKKLLKDILELRDQEALVTYSYLRNEYTGELNFFCNSIGYAIPYATQFTNPQKIAYENANVGVATLPQADPNGLFSPASAEGTWIVCRDDKTKKTGVVYVEPKLIVSPFPCGKFGCGGQ
jgi:hypothetical protein